MITLDPTAEPGLKVSGGGNLCVDGDVLVNSLGGGEDEDGNNVGNGTAGVMATNNSVVKADNVIVAGGVNDNENFEDIDGGGDSPLDAGTGVEYPDPLVDLVTPTTSNGVLNIDRGTPQASSGSLALNNPNDDPVTPNYIENPGTVDETMVLQPGIYGSIQITGGKVRFEPGIYVLKPQANVVFILDITGGDVQADGIMFYNTGMDYDPVSGLPDANDLNQPPPNPAPTEFGGVKINAGMGFSPIDTSTYTYGPGGY